MAAHAASSRHNVPKTPRMSATDLVGPGQQGSRPRHYRVLLPARCPSTTNPTAICCRSVVTGAHKASGAALPLCLPLPDGPVPTLERGTLKRTCPIHRKVVVTDRFQLRAGLRERTDGCHVALDERLAETIESAKRMELIVGDVYQMVGLERPESFESTDRKPGTGAKSHVVLVKGLTGENVEQT